MRFAVSIAARDRNSNSNSNNTYRIHSTHGSGAYPGTSLGATGRGRGHSASMSDRARSPARLRRMKDSTAPLAHRLRWASDAATDSGASPSERRYRSPSCPSKSLRRYADAYLGRREAAGTAEAAAAAS